MQGARGGPPSGPGLSHQGDGPAARRVLLQQLEYAARRGAHADQARQLSPALDGPAQRLDLSREAARLEGARDLGQQLLAVHGLGEVTGGAAVERLHGVGDAADAQLQGGAVVNQ